MVPYFYLNSDDQMKNWFVDEGSDLTINIKGY